MMRIGVVTDDVSGGIPCSQEIFAALSFDVARHYKQRRFYSISVEYPENRFASLFRRLTDPIRPTEIIHRDSKLRSLS